MTQRQTLGQFRVGTSFNPSQNETVDQIKAKAAELIDLVDAIGFPNDSGEGEMQRDAEIGRCKALAMTNIEDAAMWAVKAATKRLPE